MKKHFIIWQNIDDDHNERVGDGFAVDEKEALALALEALRKEPKFDESWVKLIRAQECVGGCIICTPNEAGK
jgi:hypothetical protein